MRATTEDWRLAQSVYSRFAKRRDIRQIAPRIVLPREIGPEMNGECSCKGEYFEDKPIFVSKRYPFRKSRIEFISVSASSRFYCPRAVCDVFR